MSATQDTGEKPPEEMTRDPLAVPLVEVLGGRSAKAVAEHLGLHTLSDLLRHYPRRYYERGQLTPLSSLRVGDEVTIAARVTHRNAASFPPKNGRKETLYKFDATVTDGTDELTVTFFHKKFFMHDGVKRDLTVGAEKLFSGKVDSFKGRLQLVNPRVAKPEEVEQFAGALVPIYPATAGLTTWQIASCVGHALAHLGEVPDPLPEGLRRRHGLPPLGEALRLIHRPADQASARRARARLRWDEAFVLQVALAQRRAAQRELAATPRVPRPGGLLEAFDARLPFELTAGQREVGAQIAEDLAQPHPMHRLLQGEVGSGKTLVALRAMLTVVDAGGQAALLAPTEVLAQQHHRSISTMLGELAQAGMLGGADVGTRVALLTGSQPAAARRQALLDAASGAAGIVVGTHALIQDAVEFADLGLVVVDEQHRFGVEQRDALRGKAAVPPHVLVMTATPIPRTVAMTVFGDLETSTLTELPRGRSPISTHVVATTAWFDRAWQRVREEVAKGHQAFVVCPRIGEDPAEAAVSGKKGKRGKANDVEEDFADDAPPPEDGGQRRPPLAVLDVAQMLAEGPLAGLRIGVLHGRLVPDEKDAVMADFAAGRLDVLVATTVVEVGVDVPNATVMVVMDADRFGVSQLHQLRGRIGRGSAPGVCLLATEAFENSPARQRLDAVAATTDGFELSRLDLEQRREGDVLGASQSGHRSSLRLLAVVRDEDVIRAAREEAVAVVDEDPELAAHPALRQALQSLVDEERAEFLEKA
ncbi:MAG TPA: ATP-dependent DNA helicase RecG [Motilibacteraceae bacterium]|nr:ATP-dependent DNA helicase RecG [Motilibacteraceae bacterium]